MQIPYQRPIQKISQFYMAKNSDTGDWGYAAEGFRTTDGDYLEVINTL